MSIEEISKTLHELIEKKAQHLIGDQTQSVEKYNSLKYTLETELDRAQQYYDQCKTQELSVGMIDAEGYLRAMKDVMESIKQVESWYPTKESSI